MRIIAGQWRGQRLTALGKGDASAHLRPTPDRVRESVFSMLAGGRFGDPLPDANVLDLFAGTGAMGLEALSRGASFCTFVDNGRTARGLLESNIARLQSAATRSKIVHMDACKLAATDTAADLVFLDPPYGKGFGDKALSSAAENGWLARGALVIWEERTRQDPPDAFTFLDTRSFGDTAITFLNYDP